jgi:hypothetical protein
MFLRSPFGGTGIEPLESPERTARSSAWDRRLEERIVHYVWLEYPEHSDPLAAGSIYLMVAAGCDCNWRDSHDCDTALEIRSTRCVDIGVRGQQPCHIGATWAQDFTVRCGRRRTGLTF